jgi:hypothetical protein
MKLAITTLLASTLSGAAAFAQTADQNARPSIIFLTTSPQSPGQEQTHMSIVNLPPVQSRCPVTMRAQHLADGGLVKTDGAHPNGIGQWLHLSLADLDSRQIARATLTVHGVTPRGHVTQTLSAGGGSPGAVKTLNVSFSAGENWTARADIWVAGMSTVERIDVNSVDYSDGSKWKIAEDSGCHINPDPLMLISSR